MKRVVVMASLLAACGPPPDEPLPDAGPSRPELAPGAVVLATQERQREDEPGPRIVVAGVARDGDRVAILARAWAAPFPTFGVSVRTLLFVSDDRAATFRELELPVGSMQTAWDVALGGGRIAIVMAGERSRLDLAEVLDDGSLGPTMALGFTPLAIDGSIITAQTSSAPGTLTVARYDVATGTSTTHTSTLPSRACTSWLFARDADGAWRRFCYATAERCVDTVDPEEIRVAPSEHCVASREWPIPQRLQQDQQRLPSGVWLTHTEGGHGHALRAASVTGGPFPASIDLGPGRVIGAWSGLLELEAWAGASGGPRMLELGADGGVRDLAFAGSPCVDPAACGATAGRGQLVRVLSMGEGRWLAMYVITSGGDDLLVVREVGDADVPVAAITEGGEPALRQPREPVEAIGALEQTCARAIACAPGKSMDDCIRYWSEVTGASAEDDAWYRRFIETPAGDCEAFRATWPEYFAPGAATCTGTCVGDIALHCTTTAMFSTDCSRLGTTCRVAEGRATCGEDASAEACDACDPFGRAVSCAAPGVTFVSDCPALGLQCFDDPDRVSPACTTGAVVGCVPGNSVCDGDVALSCASDNHVRQRVACDRLGMGCRGGECEPIGSSAPACDVDSSSTCEGALVTYCLAGERRYVDCLALGMTGCRDAPVVLGVAARAWCTF